MKWIKKFESFKQNNIAGDLISEDDIIDCIKRNGNIYATIVQEIPKNDPKVPLKPIDIDKDGLITIEQNNQIGYVKLKNVERID
jgi:hypothetical protein